MLIGLLQSGDKMAVVSLFTFALLTDGRTVRDLPKQHREKNALVTGISNPMTALRRFLLSDKEAVAQSEVDAFMENCAKRWQTREGTYQLKRRRLPDVRDSPEYPGADIDMEDI